MRTLQRRFLADGDIEAEHNVPEDVWGPVSSVGSDENFDESVVWEGVAINRA